MPSTCDPDRAVNDIEAMAFDAFEGGNQKSFCNTEPSVLILEVHRDAVNKFERITVLKASEGVLEMASQVHSLPPHRLSVRPNAQQDSVHFF